MIAIASNQTKTIKFWLPGKVVPKARPRFNRGNITLPNNYRGWKNAAYLEIISQLEENGINELLIRKAEVRMQFFGSHRGDLDNLAVI